MTPFRFLTLAFTLAAFLTGVRSSAADPIQITSGTLTVTGVQDVMSRGFLRSIWFDFSFGEFRLSGGESDGPPQNVLYPRLSSPGYLQIGDGSTRLVYIDSAFAVDATPALSPTPFWLSGRLTAVDVETRATLFDGLLAGGGTATWKFAPVLSEGRYVFSDAAVTPEPGTLLMIATGLAALATRNRRGIRRPR
jgi:hypothetical protein